MAYYDIDRYDELFYDEPNRRIVGRHTMKIKTSMEGLGERDQVEKLRGTITAMTGNALFTAPNPVPNPPLAEATTAANDAEAALNAYEAAVALVKLRRTEKNAALKVVRQTYKALAGHVMSVAAEDPVVAQNANMELVPMPAPVGELATPTGVVATTNGLEGVIKLRWNRVRGAKTYILERSATNPNDSASWVQLAMPPRVSFTDEGLASGTKYWYRIAANGAAGIGPWSNPACKMAA